MKNQFTYVIVGGGLAGASAIDGIREHDRAGSIALFAGENRLPYDRPPLSKGLWLGKATLDDLPVHDDAFYRSHDVRLYLNTEVTELHPSTHELLDAEGNHYGYEKLLIATGGSPRRLGFGEGALQYYRTVDDYLMLNEQAERVEEFLVIGGGFIGGELAAALALRGKKVTMIFPDQAILQRVLPADLSSFVTEYYRSRGVTVLTGDVPVHAERSNGRTTVRTRSGMTLSADVAVAAVGLNLHTEIARHAGLDVDNGIAVNDRLESSDRDIYAAGDVAFFPSRMLEKNIRIEHRDNALAQGRHAGENMAGADRPFEYMPYFYSDLFDLGFEAVGEIDSRLKTFADWKEKFREGVVYFLENDRVRGVLLWNVWGGLDAARGIIGMKKSYEVMDGLKGALQSA